MLFYILILLALVTSAGLLTYQFIGFERVWAVFAKDDISAWAGFANLKKTDKQNQYLVCPSGACQSPPHRIAPQYKLAPEKLMEQFHTIMLEQGAQLIKIDDATRTYIYRSHSPMLKFPDLTFALAQDVPRADGGDLQATLLIYAKAQLGELDFGANQKRIDQVLEILQMRLVQASPDQ